MRGIFGWLKARRRASDPTEEELRAGRIAAFDGLMAAAAREKHERWVSVGISVILVVFGVGYAVIGVASGANVDWDLTRWVHNGRGGGPLPFVYVMTGLIAVLMTGAGIHGLVTGSRAAKVGRERTAELLSQHQKDLAAQHPDAPRA